LLVREKPGVLFPQVSLKDLLLSYFLPFGSPSSGVSALQRETLFLTSDRLRTGSLSMELLTFRSLLSAAERSQETCLRGLPHSSWTLGSRSICKIRFLASFWSLRPTKFHLQFLKIYLHRVASFSVSPERKTDLLPSMSCMGRAVKAGISRRPPMTVSESLVPGDVIRPPESRMGVQDTAVEWSTCRHEPGPAI